MSQHDREADVEKLLSNLNAHHGRRAAVDKLLAQKLAQMSDQEPEEMLLDELERVAGGVHQPFEDNGFGNKPK